MPEDAGRSSRYIVPPDCVHTRVAFGPFRQCRSRRCREWKHRVVEIWRSEQDDWKPGTGAVLREHANVLRAL